METTGCQACRCRCPDARQWSWWFPRGTELRHLDPAHIDDVGTTSTANAAAASTATLYAAASTVQ